MVEENPSSENKQNAEQHPESIAEVPPAQVVVPPAEPSIPPTAAQASLSSNPGANQATKKPTDPIDALSQELKPVERKTLRLAWVGLIVATITGLIFWLQFHEMSKQTGILNKQAEQAATDSVESGKRVEAQLKIWSAQTKAAQDSVKAIRRQMRQDQRPWLYVLQKGAFDPINLKLPLVLINTGKTPARKVVWGNAFQVIGSGETIKFWGSKKHPLTVNSMRVGALFPYTTTEVGVEMIGARMRYRKNNNEPTEYSPATPDETSALKHGKAFMVVYGDVSYWDVFGTMHKTKYCLWQGEENFTYMAGDCTTYNNVDNN